MPGITHGNAKQTRDYKHFFFMSCKVSVWYNICTFTKFGFSLDFLVRIFEATYKNPIELKSELEKSNLGERVQRSEP